MADSHTLSGLLSVFSQTQGSNTRRSLYAGVLDSPRPVHRPFSLRDLRCIHDRPHRIDPLLLQSLGHAPFFAGSESRYFPTQSFVKGIGSAEVGRVIDGLFFRILRCILFSENLSDRRPFLDFCQYPFLERDPHLRRNHPDPIHSPFWVDRAGTPDDPLFDDRIGHLETKPPVTSRFFRVFLS